MNKKDDIVIQEKPEWVSWDMIHEVLWKAHQQNMAHGMTMRTVKLNGEELKERVGDGQCFVALDRDDHIVGTGSIKVYLSQVWFAKGLTAKLMLGAVLPEYQGRGIYRQLLQKRFDYAREKKASVILMDTAEHNLKMQKILKRYDFRYVSCFASKFSKHYSVVMAKWLSYCPYSKWYCQWRYFIQMLIIKLRYKVGGIKRFGI